VAEGLVENVIWGKRNGRKRQNTVIWGELGRRQKNFQKDNGKKTEKYHKKTENSTIKPLSTISVPCLYPVVALGLGRPCAKYLGGPLSYVVHAKIFGPLPCENVVTTIFFVCISILTGVNV